MPSVNDDYRVLAPDLSNRSAHYCTQSKAFVRLRLPALAINFNIEPALSGDPELIHGGMMSTDLSRAPLYAHS